MSNNITILCPATGLKLDTGVATTAASLADSWNKKLSVQCPHCKAAHSGLGRELFTANVMSPSDQVRGTDAHSRNILSSVPISASGPGFGGL